MKRILALLIGLAASLAGVNAARADSTVVSLPPATSLIGASTYLNQAGSSNNQLLFNPTLFGLAGGGILTLNASSITSSFLSPTISAGSCVNCNLSYDVSGRILSATNGSGGGGVTWPTNGYLVISNTTNTPGGLAPTPNGNCAIVSGGTWGVGGCGITTLTQDVVASGSGSVPATVVGLQGRPLSAAAPAPTNVMAWNGSTWIPTAATGGSGTVGSGIANQIAGYPSSGTAVSGVTVSGDFTLVGSTGIGTLTNVNGNVGSFTNANITVNAKGLITAAANGSGGGSTAFSALTSSTNTTAAMLVGTGASLGPTGTGTVIANQIPAALGTGSVCSTAGVLSAPVSCPIVPVVIATSTVPLVAANAGALVLGTNGSPTTATLAQSTGSLGTGFGLDFFTDPSTSTLNVTTSTINGLSSIKLGAYQDIAIAATASGNYVGALSVPQPPTQTGTTCLLDNMTWASCGSGTVNAGTATHLAYYATSTNAVSNNAALTETGVLEGINYGPSALRASISGTALQLAQTTSENTRVELDAFGAAGHFSSARYDGTAASPTALLSGDLIGSYNAWGYNGTSLVGPMGAFRCVANQNWGVGFDGTYCDVTTTVNGSATAAEAIRFENDGGITVPSTVTGGDKGPGTINAANLYVNGTAVGSGAGNMVGSGATTSGNILLSNNTGATLNTAVDSGVAPSSVDDPTVTGPFTATQWQNNDTLVINSANQTVTAPPSSTLTRNGGLVIATISGTTTLLATSPDVIASISGTTAAGGSITLSAGTLSVVTAKVSGTIKVVNVPVTPVSISYSPTVNPNGIPFANFLTGGRAIYGVRCTPEAAVGAAATIAVYKAPSGTAIASGIAITSNTFNANSGVATDQNLTLTTHVINAGDRLGLITTGGSNWTSGSGAGVCTVFIQ